MKCPYCGRELASGATTCSGCGAAVGGSPTNNTQVNNGGSNQSPTFESNKNSNKSGIIIVILFLLIIAVVCYFMFFAGGGSSNSESNKESNNETENGNTEQDDNLINKSKNEAYASTGHSYIFAIRNELNMGTIKVYTPNVMYLVPVGDSDKCGQVESGGSSPYSKGWNYAFVGVVYSGDYYNYYFISEDDKNIGFPLVSYNELSGDKIYKGHQGSVITDDISTKLKELYLIESKKELDATNDADVISVLTPASETINKVIVISASEC